MTKHHFLYPLLIAAGLALAVFLVRAEIAVARTEERSKAHAENIQSLTDQQKSDDARLKAVLDQLEQARNKPATVQTVTKYLPAPLPAGSEVKIEQLPDSPAPQLVLTGDVQKNLDAIQGMEIRHLQCDKSLETCKSNGVIAAKKLSEMTGDRDNWRDTAKGGSKLHRFVKVVKVAGCAGAGAAVGSLWKYRGAAIGGAAGAAGCSFFW